LHSELFFGGCETFDLFLQPSQLGIFKLGFSVTQLLLDSLDFSQVGIAIVIKVALLL
jgi:hypothetical protein